MHLHLLGICGTFMAGIAVLARELGHHVTGSDRAFHPPMSEQLEALGVGLHEGYDAGQLSPRPDLVLVGNALSRGMPVIEALLDAGIPYTSAPQWLAEAVLHHREVVAVAGTHGKTTTTTLIAQALAEAGLEPGYLIGGLPRGLPRSAALGAPDAPFVIEADEYDTAFFDKRAKFVHFRPLVAVINNIEFDHADIYPDLEAIERQFHHLVRTVPGRGTIVAPLGDAAVERVLARGCWSGRVHFGDDPHADWSVAALEAGWGRFLLTGAGRTHEVAWPLAGRHNALNAAAAAAALAAIGVPASRLVATARQFHGCRRRLEPVGERHGITVIDDFAHHPSAIAATLTALRARDPAHRLIAVLELRSNSMRAGAHAAALAASLEHADRVLLLCPPDLPWDPGAATAALGDRREVLGGDDALLERLRALAAPGDIVVFMSNGDLRGLPRRLLAAL